MTAANETKAPETDEIPMVVIQESTSRFVHVSLGYAPTHQETISLKMHANFLEIRPHILEIHECSIGFHAYFPRDSLRICACSLGDNIEIRESSLRDGVPSTVATSVSVGE